MIDFGWRGAVCSAIVLAAIFAANRLIRILQPHQDPREPPLAEQNPPIIGHILGMIYHGNSYLEKITERTSRPIFTLPLPGSKMYLVKSPDTMALIHRHSRTLTFSDIITLQLTRTMGFTPSMWEHYKDKPTEREAHKAQHANLAPNKIHDMHERSFNVLSDSLDVTSEVTVRIGPWLRGIMMRAGATALYGEDNPLAWDSSLIEEMKHFEDDEGILFLGNPWGIFQPLFARKGYKAIRKYQAAFIPYYEKGLARNASAFIRGRLEVIKPLWDFKTIAMLDILMVQAATLNQMSCTAWLLWRIFGDAELLNDIRQEVLVVMEKGTEVNVVMVDGTRILNECPLLLSTWKEVLRYYVAAPSVRYVAEDTVLENGHLLKKGAIIQMMGGYFHNAEEYWGSNVKDFDARRFMRVENGAGENSKRNKAYIPFGGGVAWCPGRHYITNQVLAFVSAMVIAFEVKSPGGELVEVPEYGPKNMVDSVRPPRNEPFVKISRHPGFMSAKFELRGGTGVAVNF